MVFSFWNAAGRLELAASTGAERVKSRGPAGLLRMALPFVGCRQRVAPRDEDIAARTLEYMTAMETALQPEASGLEGDYRILADFNGTVLAGTHSKHSVHFVTWDWDYDRTGLSHGHYFMENYNGAKQNFAIRSGLIHKEQLFSPEQMTEIYRCCADSVDGDFFDLTAEQEKVIRSVQQQIEDCVPDLAERIRQQEDAMEQTM